MSIGSPPSTPPQSPIRPRSPSPVAPPTAILGKPSSLASTTQHAPMETQEPSWTHIEDAASRSSQVSPVSSETVDMDLQSSPSLESSASSDDIPGFITGAASRRTRAPSPLVLPVAPIKSSVSAQTPAPPSAQTMVTSSPTSTLAATTAPSAGESVTEKPEPPPTASKRAPIKNPFVSGGFITEFVGEKDSLTTRKNSTDRPSVSEMTVSWENGPPGCIYDDIKQPSPVEQLPVKTEPTVLDSIPPPKASPVSQPLKLIVPENKLQSSLGQSISIPLPPRPQPTLISLPSRPSDPTKGYPNGSSSSVVKPGYQPITSANDPRLTYTSTGSISNPLNIRPSRHPPPAPLKSGARVLSPPPGPKRKVVVGNGWPYNRQTNGHAAAASATSASPPISKPPLPLVQPLTPESTRSSTTPPGLSGLAPYSSPSPPGFLHGSSAPKSTASLDQGRFGMFSQPVSTPQIKHGEFPVTIMPALDFHDCVQKPTTGRAHPCPNRLLVFRHKISQYKRLDPLFPHPQPPLSSSIRPNRLGRQCQVAQRLRTIIKARSAP